MTTELNTFTEKEFNTALKRTMMRATDDTGLYFITQVFGEVFKRQYYFLEIAEARKAFEKELKHYIELRAELIDSTEYTK